MVGARLSALNCNHIDYGTVTMDLRVNSNGHDRGITSPALRDAGLDTDEMSKSSPPEKCCSRRESPRIETSQVNTLLNEAAPEDSYQENDESADIHQEEPQLGEKVKISEYAQDWHR